MADARRTEVHRYLRGLFNVGTVAGLSDGELLDRFTARRGESAELAFAALVERHGPMVLRVCRKVLHDSDDAADAFQATFLVLARKAGSIHRRDSLGAYLHGVALRVASCNRSAVVRRRRHERTYAEKAGTAYQAKPPDDLGRVLHEELGRLPERFRGVAVLCDLEGKTYVEAAGLLGCPPGTVMSRLAEARRRLRGRLARRGLAPSAGAIGAVLAAESAAAAKGLPAALAEATIQAATRFAAGPATAGAVVSASVTTLTEGVLRAMFLTKLKSVAMLGLVGGVVATGAGVLAQVPEPLSQASPRLSSEPAPSLPQNPDSVTPADERLHSLEKKLDRLLKVLEANAVRTSSPAAMNSSASSMTPGMEHGMGMAPGMGMMGMGMKRSSGPAMDPGMGMMSSVPGGRNPMLLTNAVPRRRNQASTPNLAQADPNHVPNVEERLEMVEQRLDELVGRIERLEGSGLVNSSGERATQMRGDDGDPSRRTVRTSNSEASPDVSRPASPALHAPPPPSVPPSRFSSDESLDRSPRE